MRVYGPYKRKDGRKHVIIIHSDGTRQTQSYPRYIMEQHLGRRLESHETVDHINENYADDRIENLQILSREANARKSVLPAKMYKSSCPMCGRYFEKPFRNVIHNIRKGKSGPFCSRSCAGKSSVR
jgi:hypothetical protein